MGMESWNFQEEKLETATLAVIATSFSFRISCYALVISSKPEPPRAPLIPQRKLGSMEQQQLRKSLVNVRMSLWGRSALGLPCPTLQVFWSLKYGRVQCPENSQIMRLRETWAWIRGKDKTNPKAINYKHKPVCELSQELLFK